MKIIDVEQRSPEWFQLRTIPTSSNFGKIFAGTGKKSTSANKYMEEILAQWIAGKPVDSDINSPYIDRGVEQEPVARAMYEFLTDNVVSEVGFCIHDSGLFGGSPDGLVGDDGGLEIKCVKASTLIHYYRSGFPVGYKPQVQGYLLITGRKWWDFFAYNADMDPYMERVERDENYISGLEKALMDFCEKLERVKDELKEYKL